MAERAQDARGGGAGGEEFHGGGFGKDGFELDGVGDGLVAEIGDEPAAGAGEVDGVRAGVAARFARAGGLAGGEAGGEALEAGGGAGEAGPERDDDADAARIAQEGVRDEGGEGHEEDAQARGEGRGLGVEG